MSAVKFGGLNGELFDIVSKLRWIGGAIRRRLVLAKLRIAMLSRKSITGDAPAVVCLTSYGQRMEHVHFTIQSIASGVSKPSQIILWVSHSDESLISTKLRSLQYRGLEIRFTENYGPHTKYYPYCAAAPALKAGHLPLVTADDDVLYPPNWLRDLTDAAEAEPYPVIVAHRAHRMTLTHGTINPYLSWQLESGTLKPCYANVATGVCGVLYPPEFVLQVASMWNTEFRDAALSADDLWLHSRSVLLKIPTKQVAQRAARVVEHHPHPDQYLSEVNVAGGENDAVVCRIYTSEIIFLIQSDINCDGH